MPDQAPATAAAELLAGGAGVEAEPAGAELAGAELAGAELAGAELAGAEEREGAGVADEPDELVQAVSATVRHASRTHRWGWRLQ